MGRGMGPSFTNASSFYVVPGPSLFCPIDRPVPNLVAPRRPLSQGLYFSPRYMHKHEILGERGEQSEPLIEAIATFEEAGLGDGGTGLVITTGDGVEFRVSITRNS